MFNLLQFLRAHLIKCSFLFAILLISSSFYTASEDWGFFGHRRINRMAVFTLPPEMLGFYKKNIEYLTEHAVDPDKRRYATKHEAVRHYIDIDHWGTYPFPEVPRDWTETLMKFTDIYAINTTNDTIHLFGNDVMSRIQIDFSKKTSTYQSFFVNNVLNNYYEDNWWISCDSLNQLLAEPIDCQTAFAIDRFSQHGILPYHLLTAYRQLISAFKAQDYNRILRNSAEIGHYIGDAHVPLHTTTNYNGQLTNQVGIHAFWESRLPELYADKEYDFFVGKATYIENPRDFFWNIVLESHLELDSVLLIEQALKKEFPADQQLCYEERLSQMMLTQCEPFARAYHARMDGMVERRMTASVKAIGDVWYSAWVNAGQPNLKNLTARELSRLEQKEREEIEQQFRSGSPKGRAHSENE